MNAIITSQPTTIKSNSFSYDILKNPLITEKTYALSLKKVYVFKVSKKSNKIEVKKAVEQLYGVKVNHVRILNVKQENVVVRGKRGQKAGYKKAIISLSVGHSITL